MLPDLSQRATVNELMDDPTCNETLLIRTLQQFSSVNRLVARYRSILKRWVLTDMLKEPEKPYHLVDMGAGGCDTNNWLLQAARKQGLNLQISACDIDPRTIEYAQSTYGHIPGLQIRETDLLTDSFGEPVDYVFANHFLHHLTENEIISLIRLWQPRVRRRMVFSDLLRDKMCYLGFSIISLIYTHSFTRPDGLTSIRRGFKTAELAAMADAAGINKGFSTHRLHPGRVVLCIDGTAEKTA